MLDQEILNNLQQKVCQPTKCHLWSKVDLSEEDVYMSFDIVRTFIEESHFSRRLIKCRFCGQLYLRQFYEEIDYESGADPQYFTFIPVISEHDAEMLNQADLFEIGFFSPSFNCDYPKGELSRMYWGGK